MLESAVSSLEEADCSSRRFSNLRAGWREGCSWSSVRASVSSLPLCVDPLLGFVARLRSAVAGRGELSAAAAGLAREDLAGDRGRGAARREVARRRGRLARSGAGVGELAGGQGRGD